MKIKDLKDKDLLYADIEFTIDRIKNKKRTYVSLYRVSKILTFIAGALITVLVGWNKGIGQQLDFNIYYFSISSVNLILIISTAITLLAAIEGLLNFKDKSMSYDFILFDLRRLRDRMCFDYKKSQELYDKNKEEYFNKYHDILESQKTIIKDSYEEQ